MPGDLEDESTALIKEAKVTRKSSKQKQSQNIQEQLMTLQKQQTDLLKKQHQSNNQFFANMIKVPQEIDRKEREKDREFFFK